MADEALEVGGPILMMLWGFELTGQVIETGSFASLPSSLALNLSKI